LRWGCMSWRKVRLADDCGFYLRKRDQCVIGLSWKLSEHPHLVLRGVFAPR